MSWHCTDVGMRCHQHTYNATSKESRLDEQATLAAWLLRSLQPGWDKQACLSRCGACKSAESDALVLVPCALAGLCSRLFGCVRHSQL
jgi:hypothetical protein